MTGVHNNPNVGGINGPNSTGSTGEVKGSGELTPPSGELSTMRAGNGGTELSAISAPSTGGTSTRQAVLDVALSLPQSRLDKIAQNYETHVNSPDFNTRIAANMMAFHEAMSGADDV